MKKFELNTKHSVSTLYYAKKLHEFDSILNRDDAVFVTDVKLHDLYNDYFGKKKVIIVPEKENSKTMECFESLIESLLDLNADRNSMLIAFGGGSISDLTGFAASVYKRGLSHAFVPTTLLAQADASIGGKNGLNFKNIKNVIGSFKQPDFIAMPSEVLSTLDDIQLQSGLAEILKSGLLGADDVLDYISTYIENINNKEHERLSESAFLAAKFKCEIVSRDEFDRAERKYLNFGHTFGHAFESIYGLEHGIAVGYGMICALRLSVIIGLMPNSVYEDALKYFALIGINTTFDFDLTKVLELILHDKKRNGDRIDFVFLRSIGEPVIKNIKINDLNKIAGTA